MADNNEAFLELQRSVSLIAQQLSVLMNDRQPPLTPRRSVDYEATRSDDRNLKVDVADFDGSLDPEIYLEWERGLERYFDFKDTPEDKQFKLAKLKLTKHAEVWLLGVQNQRQREGKLKISTWPKLKKSLRRKYVPTNYKQQLYVKWSSLQQGKRSVAEYLREFEKLCLDCDIVENEDLKLGRFMSGLNFDLREQIEVFPNLGFEDACKMAITFEKQRKKKGGTTYGSESLVYKDKVTFGGGEGSSKAETTANPKAPIVSEPSRGPRKDLRDITCFKCHGRGHMKHDCPNARAFTEGEWMDIKASPNKRVMVVLREDGTEEEVCPSLSPNAHEGLYRTNSVGKLVPCTSDFETTSSEEEREVCMPEEEIDTRASLVIRKALQARSKEVHEQRECIFQTRGRVNGELCSIVVDSGSETDCVASSFVHKMGLKTTKHPLPYNLSWLEDSNNTTVRKQCLIKFSVGSYEDERKLDVVPMDACNLLLGRPWQSDKRSKHNGWSNVYEITHGGKKFTLMPLPSSKHEHIVKSDEKGSLFMGKAEKRVARKQLHEERQQARELVFKQQTHNIGDLVFVDAMKGKFSNRMRKHKSMLAGETCNGPFPIVERPSQEWVKVELWKEPVVVASFRVEDCTPYRDAELLNLRANSFQEGGSCTMLDMGQEEEANLKARMSSLMVRKLGWIKQMEVVRCIT